MIVSGAVVLTGAWRLREWAGLIVQWPIATAQSSTWLITPKDRLAVSLEPQPHGHHHNFLLAWVLLGRHGTPKQQKTHCRAAGLGSQWDVTGTLGNPRFEL